MRSFILLALLIPFYSLSVEVKLESVSVHLFLEKSGDLSQDILTTNEFMSHNFRPFGDGIPANEIFHDF